MLSRNYLKVPLFLICFLFLFAGSGLAAQGADASPPSAKARMTLGQATVLGVVEGLTEYLPVSSTGHLLLAEKAMGIGEDPGGPPAQQKRDKDAADAYTIVIQAGAILAVLGLYWRRVRQMLAGLKGEDEDGRRMFTNIVVGFLPAAVIGLAFNKIIKAYLFGPWPVVGAWFVGGVAILAVAWWQRRSERPGRSALPMEALTWRMALIIGFAQCIAMWPGVSRSLVTIVGGVLVGLSLPAAVEFSFLLGVVTLGAATGYDGLKHGHIMVQTFAPLSLAVGVLFAFLAAVVSVKWMVGYLNKHGLSIFGYYRVGLALVVGVLIFKGMM
jgi:undecaprenyl-diphosphatase